MTGQRTTSPKLMHGIRIAAADPGEHGMSAHLVDSGGAGDPIEGTRAPRPSIVVVNPRTFMRECMAKVLGNELTEFEVIGVRAVEDLNAFTKRTPHLVVLIIESDRHLMTTLKRHVAAIGQAVPQTPILLLSQCDDQLGIAEACECGVNGYVTMSSPLDVIVAVLRLVLVGGGYFPTRIASQPETGAQWSEDPPAPEVAEIEPETQSEQQPPQAVSVKHLNFTPRETQVIAALARGLSNKVIGGELDISENTVKVHVRHIMRKIGVTNRTAAALFEQRHTSQKQMPPQVHQLAAK